MGLQFRELFRDGLYFELSKHANAMALRLSEGLRRKGIEFSAETETNRLFPILENTQIEALKRSFDFYVWEPVDDKRSITRLVTSWATPEEAVGAFIGAL
ncbi:hypothetical protein [Boseongicola aestuarii]|uniref:Low specificity L-threonine aldolase n=1 Tax=Boseongicola aestuarii TaxID=1470561 RepID=A0A238J4L2_9RHOB|nr:hypothetical protein [Boseongicola aestuarii]SMX25689.1 hypothetical protein BOA8489_03833 [Boseongicola aestuarii]